MVRFYLFVPSVLKTLCALRGDQFTRRGSRISHFAFHREVHQTDNPLLRGGTPAVDGVK
jgi:hypothetical protein